MNFICIHARCVAFEYEMYSEISWTSQCVIQVYLHAEVLLIVRFFFLQNVVSCQSIRSLTGDESSAINWISKSTIKTSIAYLLLFRYRSLMDIPWPLGFRMLMEGLSGCILSNGNCCGPTQHKSASSSVLLIKKRHHLAMASCIEFDWWHDGNEIMIIGFVSSWYGA